MGIELLESLDDYSAIADEQDPYKDFDTKLLYQHTYRDNLLWHIAVISKQSPANLEVIRALIVSAYATHEEYKHKFHIFLTGDSASGKTQKCEHVRSFLPFDNRIRATDTTGKITSDVSQLSPKAIFYGSLNKRGKGKDAIPEPLLCSNRIVYLDDVAQGEIEMLKKLTNTSGEVPTHTVTNKDNDGIKMMVLDGKPTVWCSKVSTFEDDGGQTLSRFYKIECEKELEAVHNHIILYKPDEQQKDSEERLKSFIANRIKQHCIFDIPVELLKKLPIPTITNRDSTFELVCLQVISKINVAWDYDFSKPIVPTETDLRYTIDMFQGKTSIVHNTNISSKAKQILEYISCQEPNVLDMKEGTNPNGQTIEALLSIAGIVTHFSYKTIQRLILELEKSGSIAVFKGYNGKKYFYKAYNKEV